MAPPHFLEKQAEARLRAAKAKADRIRAFRERRAATPTKRTEPDVGTPPAVPHASPLETPWRNVRAGQGGLSFADRANPKVPTGMQPWTRGLVDDVLEAAREQTTTLCLIWPARIDSIAPLHAFATLERSLAGDLRGMRSVLFPGSHASASALHRILVDRDPLTNVFRQVWGDGSALTVATQSDSFLAMLAAMNDIRNWASAVSAPSLAETIPTFVATQTGWGTTLTRPLERSLRRVSRLSLRRQIRADVSTEWREVNKAPGALLVIHHASSKADWRRALTACWSSNSIRPEVLLLDATSGAAGGRDDALRTIPEFLKSVKEVGLGNVGSVLVTDDPKTFFVMRKMFADMRVKVNAKTYAAEGTHAFLAANPVTDDWSPEVRSNSRFKVDIVDRDASAIAVRLQSLAKKAGSEHAQGHKALKEAALYVLRLSNLPAGFNDLLHCSQAGELDAFSIKSTAWSSVELGVRTALATGALNALRQDVDQAVARASRLIDDWADATPMAVRMLAIVERFGKDSKIPLVVVLPSQRYIRLAHQFLQRKLASTWPAIEPNVKWRTLATVNELLASTGEARNYLFVGMNSDVVRLLVAHPTIPHGTNLLVAYRQAESQLKTLQGMKELEALKPYRGRIGLLVQELDRKLKAVPNPVHIERLGEMSFTFKLDEVAGVDTASEQLYFRFDLEGGKRAFSSGWAYRYNADEDPCFCRVAASHVEPGFMLFEMSDELRSKIEAALHLDGGSMNSIVHPERAFLKLYHDDVLRRSEFRFGSPNRAALAAAIRARMLELDASASECSAARVEYWLRLAAGDDRPHAPKDAKFFKQFCRALDVPDDDALTYWNFVKNARRLNQNLGRALAAQYAEILFQPESAQVYRRIPLNVVKQLQQEALSCVYRVESVMAPQEQR